MSRRWIEEECTEGEDSRERGKASHSISHYKARVSRSRTKTISRRSILHRTSGHKTLWYRCFPVYRRQSSVKTSTPLMSLSPLQTCSFYGSPREASKPGSMNMRFPLIKSTYARKVVPRRSYPFGDASPRGHSCFAVFARCTRSRSSERSGVVEERSGWRCKTSKTQDKEQ